MSMFYDTDLVVVSCDIGNTVIVNFMTGDLKILDYSSSWIATISLDQEQKIVMIGGSEENNFRIYDFNRPDGEQHVVTFARN